MYVEGREELLNEREQKLPALCNMGSFSNCTSYNNSICSCDDIHVYNGLMDNTDLGAWEKRRVMK